MPSHGDAFVAYHRESRPRLLHQTYAYCGSTEAANLAIDDAYVAAAHHWRKLDPLAGPDRDSWLRTRALSLGARPPLRAAAPWYVTARQTADAHRPLLTEMQALSPTDRHLVVAHWMAGLDVSTAGREAGVPDAEARRRLEGVISRFTAAGLPGTPGEIVSALDDLRSDLREHRADRADSLRREGTRRRRSHLLLAGVSAVALGVGAGAMTAADPSEGLSVTSPDVTGPTSPGRPTEPTSPATSTPTADVDPFSTVSLLSRKGVQPLDPSRRWNVSSTSLDFEIDKPLDDCYTGDPDPQARHHWIRRFSSGTGDSPNEAIQVLEVARSAPAAQAAYDRVVSAFATCPAGTRQLTDIGHVLGLGDDSTVMTLLYADGTRVRDELIAVTRSGSAVLTWLVRATGAHPVRVEALVAAAAISVDAVCADAEGRCSGRGRRVVDDPLPLPRAARGFLAVVDLPRFGSIERPWVATRPEPVTDNPAATVCGEADFTAEGAKAVRARSFVIPQARSVPAIFGLTQTVGTFGSVAAARDFMAGSAASMSSCARRQPNVTVASSDTLAVAGTDALGWQVDAATSQDTAFVSRVALLRSGRSVTEVTFTPADALDTGSDGYTTLAARAAYRLTQL